MALEILVPNAAIRNLIREDKIHQIYSMMQTGQDKFGMQTFNQALATLHHKRQITLEVAMQRSSNADELKELIDRGMGLNEAYGGGNGHGPQRGRCRTAAHTHREEVSANGPDNQYFYRSYRPYKGEAMPTFAFKGRNRLNELIAGEREAATQDELRALLRREQIVMTQASEKGREISIPKIGRRKKVKC